MALRISRRQQRGGDPINGGEKPVGANELDAFIILTDSRRKHKCSAEFVRDLRERIMTPALAELNHCFAGQRWIRAIQPVLTLEGPGVDFRVSIIKVEGWEFSEMYSQINGVFSKYWDQEIDRIPPW